jgi:hypothetical protein
LIVFITPPGFVTVGHYTDLRSLDNHQGFDRLLDWQAIAVRVEPYQNAPQINGETLMTTLANIAAASNVASGINGPL